MKRILAFVLLLVCAAAHAQFTPGQVLTAAQLNNQFSLYVPLAGGTLTGPLTVPTLASSNVTITGGTISGLSSPVPQASGGTGSTSIASPGGAFDVICSSTVGQVWVRLTGGWGCNSLGYVNPDWWGAVGNGSTDDTAAIQSAITAAPTGGRLFLPRLYAVSSVFITSKPITIFGLNGGQGEYSSTCNTGLVTTTTNMSVFPALQAGSVVRDICITTSLTNTSGVALGTAAAAHSVQFDHNQINGQCISIAVTGSGTTQTKNALVSSNVIRPAANAACAAFAIGQSSTGANTGDGVYRDNVVYCTNSATGFYLYDSGGDAFTNNNVYACGYGTVIKPGANQQVLFAYFTSTILGDYSANNDLLIDTSSSTAGIASLFFIGTWTSGDGLTSATGPSVLIQNTGGAGNFQGIKFLGHRTYNYTAGNDAFKISGGNVKFVEVQNSHVCSGVTGSGSVAGIHVTSGPAYTRLQNNVIGACDVGGSFPDGILVDSGANNFTITGNDLSTGTTAWTILLSGTTSSTTAIVKDNAGVDTGVTSVASAATISLFAGSLYSITGTTAITTINTMWSGRLVYMTTPSGVAFNTGGNICNAVTSAAGATVMGYWTGSCWQLK